MTKHGVCSTIDLERREFSMVIVDPRPNLLEWLDAFVKSKGREKYRFYAPEENTVLIIPKIDSFAEPGSLNDFLNEIKPKLLRAELSRFRATPEDLGPLTKETFDKFFELSVRSSPLFMSDLN